MEQFVLGIFQEQLAKFIVGFRKEQVTASLLNGKGEIHDVELNCAFLNDELTKITPFIELESVHVSKFSFHVSSWTNIRKAPIIVDVEHIKAVAVEPLRYKDRSRQQQIRQITRYELIELIRKGLLKPKGTPYNIFDRIVDNLTVEVSTCSLRYQTLGKFKTRRPGPWTPPEIHVTLAGIRLVSVDEYGLEAPPEEVWRHNHNRRAGTFMIYKKLEMEYQVAIQPVGSVDEIRLVSGRQSKMEIQVAMERRIQDGAWLAVQFDTTIPQADVNIPATVVPLLAHVVAGATYCFSKDRAFHDPLKSTTEMAGNCVSTERFEVSREVAAGEAADEAASELGSLFDRSLMVDEEVSSEEDDENEFGARINSSDLSSRKIETKPAPIRASTIDPSMEGRPVILFPNGIVIHDRISLSVSVHDATLRGTYATLLDGYVQLTAKGCIVEAIWPKITFEKGGYVQASISFLSIVEKSGSRIRTVLEGGEQYGEIDHSERAGKPPVEFAREDTFPLYEERSVRPDPLGLREPLPAQAFGLKTTVDFVQSASRNENGIESIQFIHEIGIDHFDLTFDSGPLCRVARFAMNEGGDGFDSRWHTGDWASDLTTEMLVRPTGMLKLEDFVQPTKPLFLDENAFISSDLFNATIRIMCVNFRIPAAINSDVRSCDVIAKVDEIMIIISSALPRTMLSGNIGTYVDGEHSKTNERIVFPNDPSDFAYVLESSEDPSNRQRGEQTSRPISTFRLQLTVRGFSVRLLPVVPFCSALESQELLNYLEFSMITCLEGKPTSPDASNLTEVVLFTSVQVYRCEINFDFDLAISAVSTLSFHFANVSRISDILFRSQPISDGVELSETIKIRNSLKGRRILVEKQILHCRETDGLRIACYIKVDEYTLCLWRQNVPCSPLRRNVSTEEKDKSRQVDYIALVLVMKIEMEALEIGLETTFHRLSRHLVLKACLGSMSLWACDANLLLSATRDQRNDYAEGDSNAKVDRVGIVQKSSCILERDKIVQLLKIGCLGQGGTTSAEIGDSSLAMRIEEKLGGSRAWSFALDLPNGGTVTLDAESIKILCVFVLQGLFTPIWTPPARRSHPEPKENYTLSIGELLRNALRFILSSKGMDGMPEGENLAAIDSHDDVSSSVRVSKFLKYLLPSDVEVFVARGLFQNVQLRFWAEPDTQKEGMQQILVLNHADLLFSYFRTMEATSSGILAMRAQRALSWAKILDVKNPGLRYAANIRQSLQSVSSTGELTVTILPESLVSFRFDNSEARFSVPKELHVDNTSRFLEAIVHVINFGRRCLFSYQDLRVSLSSMRSTQSPPLYFKVPPCLPLLVSCESVTKSLKKIQLLLQRAKRRHMIITHNIEDQWISTNSHIQKLQLSLFQRERERLGALALVSSQASGWLRLGCARRSGMRGSLSTMVWPYWCILRKSLLHVFEAPGMTLPVEIIPLEGVDLQKLGGGKRKRDLKRAMAIVETTGLVRVIITGTDREYYVWAREIQKCAFMKAGQNDSKFDFAERYDSSRRGEASSASFAEESYHQNGTPTEKSQDAVAGMGSKASRPFVKGLSRVAKATRQAVSDRSGRPKAIDNETTIPDEKGVHENDSVGAEDFSYISSTVASDLDDSRHDRSQLHGRFAGVRQATKSRLAGAGQVTKSKFGSALQAARQKGREVADKRRGKPEKEPAMDNEIEQSRKSGMNIKGIERPEISLDSILPGNYWVCALCKHENSKSSKVCEICNATDSHTNCQDEISRENTFDNKVNPPSRVTDDGSSDVKEKLGENDVVAENESYDPQEGTAMELDQLSSRAGGVRHRLGAAVRNVRRHVRDNDEGSAASRFAIRRRNGSSIDSGLVPGAPQIINLRNVTTEGPLSTAAYVFGDPRLEVEGLPLKRLQGNWFVKVSSVLTGNNEITGSDQKPLPAVNNSKLHNTSLDTAIPTVNEDDGSIASYARSETQLKSESDATKATDRDETGRSRISLDMADSSSTARVASTDRMLSRLFKIEVHHVLPAKIQHEAVSAHTHTIADILTCHALMSEAVAKLPSLSPLDFTVNIGGRDEAQNMSESVAQSLGLTTLDAVRITGNMLGGLFQQLKHSDSVQVSEYCAEVIAEFFNSMLYCALPIDALAILSDFLQIESESIETLDPNLSPALLNQDSSKNRPSGSAGCGDADDSLFPLLSKIESELLCVEHDMHVTKQFLALASQRNEPVHASDAPPAFHTFHEAMHVSLLKVMAERDEAHAKLVAADVMHVHELEQQRKQVQQLTARLEALSKPQTATNAEESGKMQRMQKQMQQNSDVELISLCQQLTGEISARTAASLEVLRLKESRKIERDIEKAEKRALLDELQSLKTELAREKALAKEAQCESQVWKQSYEHVARMREATILDEST
jgi:hypothetical protein